MKLINKIKADPRVESVDYEGEDGWWVYLKNGFICEDSETHAVHEWTLKDLRRSFGSVRVCECQDCKKST